MSPELGEADNPVGPDFDAVQPLGIGTPDGSSYRLYRSRSGPFWLLPDGKAGRAAGGLLYSPQSLPGELLRLAMRLGRLPSARVRLDSSAVGELRERLAGLLGLPAVELGFMAGPRRPGNKFIAAVMTPDGRPVAFAKVAPSRPARERLANEAAALALLAAAGMKGSVPTVVGRFAWRDCEVLLLTPGPSPRGPKRFGEMHIAFLARLQQATRRTAEFGRTATGAALRAAATAEGLRPEERDRYARTLHHLERTFGSSPLPTALAHRDFVPWNTRRTGDSLWVFDWESARGDDLAVLDVFHFGFVPSALMGGAEPAGWVADALRRLWPDGASMLADLRLAYLADVSWQYARELGPGGYARDNPVLARAWGGMDRCLAGSPA